MSERAKLGQGPGQEAGRSGSRPRVAGQAALPDLARLELLLTEAAQAQERFWDAQSALERALGETVGREVELDVAEMGELTGWTVGDLLEEFESGERTI